jgi:hypothetical protein
MKFWHALVGLALGTAVMGACAAPNDKNTPVAVGPDGGTVGSGPDATVADSMGSTDSGFLVDSDLPDGSGLSCDAAKDHKSSIGCDYYSLVPGGMDDFYQGNCFAAYVANTSTNEAAIEVTYDGHTLDVGSLARIPSGAGADIKYAPLPGGKLPPGQMAILFLMNYKDPSSTNKDWVSCPAGVTAGVTSDSTQSNRTAILKAFHITTSEPVVAYDIYPYGGAKAMMTSATLLVPTSAWDTNYVAVEAYPAHPATVHNTPFVQITAAQAGTTVTVNPTSAIEGGTGVAPTASGVPHTYTLNAGEVLQLKQSAELSGSIIESNNPVGVWGGHACMQIELDDSACDTGHQQLFPVHAMGSEYVAIRHKDRTSAEEQPPWRLVGAVDTTLTFTPPVSGAPTKIGKGEVVEFYAPGPFVVTSPDSEHPFYFGAHMTGQFFQKHDYTTGDPEWVNVVPPLQYMDKYIFFTDPTMGNTNLVVVRHKAKDGTFKPVSLDCLSAPLDGWLPVGSSDYEYTRVDITTGNGVGKSVNGCNNGMHEMHSDEPFGVTVWGWDVTVSYAYPAGEKVEVINHVVIH